MSDTNKNKNKEVESISNSIMFDSHIYGGSFGEYDKTGVINYLSNFTISSKNKNTMIRMSDYLYDSKGYYFQSIENSIVIPIISSLIVPIPKFKTEGGEEDLDKTLSERNSYHLFLSKLNHRDRAFECLRSCYKYGVSVSFIDIKYSKGKESIRDIKFYPLDVSYIDIIGYDGISSRVAINLSDFYGDGYSLNDIPKSLRSFIIKMLKKDNRKDLINPTKEIMLKLKEDKYKSSYRVVLPNDKTIVVINGDSGSTWGVIPSLLGIKELATSLKSQSRKLNAFDTTGKTVFVQTFPKAKNGDKSTMTQTQQASQHSGLRDSLSGDKLLSLASLQPETQLEMFKIVDEIINVDDGDIFTRQGIETGYSTGLLSGDVKTDKVAVELNKMIGNKMHILLEKFSSELNRIYNSININNNNMLKMMYVKNNDYIKETNAKWADKLYTNGSGSREHYYAIASGMDSLDYMNLLEFERQQKYRETYLPNPTAHTLSGKDSDNLSSNDNVGDGEVEKEEGDLDE